MLSSHVVLKFRLRGRRLASLSYCFVFSVVAGVGGLEVFCYSASETFIG